MFKCRSCTCACVHASVVVRSNAAGSRSASSATSSRLSATAVAKVTRPVAPGSSWIRRSETIGSRTDPTVLERGRPSRIEPAFRTCRPPQEARPVRLVLHAAHGRALDCRDVRGPGDPLEDRDGASRSAPRALARTPSRRRGSRRRVLSSAAEGASTTSAYDVISICRARVPRFVTRPAPTCVVLGGDDDFEAANRPVAASDLHAVRRDSLAALRRDTARLVTG